MAENRRLVSFHLAGLTPAPRAVPQIEVTFDINASGVLTISARNVETGDEQAVTIAEVVDVVGEAPTAASYEIDTGGTTRESYAGADEASADEEVEASEAEATEAE